MYIVHVIPITRQLGIDSLSYFTFKDIPLGSVVNVPLRKAQVPALVLRKEDAGAIKSLLRTQTYSTKNIKDPRPRQLLSSSFIKAARDTADYFAAPIGSVLNSFLPAAILKDDKASESSDNPTQSNTSNYEILTIQSTKEERLDAYKTILRGSLARGESALLLVPTVHEALNCKKLYEKGIEKYVFTLHSGLSAKAQRETWHKAISEEHPVLIIATRGFLGIPRANMGVFVVEEEGSQVYREIARPFIDSRILIDKLAQHIGAKLILGDTLLSSAVHKKLLDNTATEFERPARRLRSGARVVPIDMSEYTRQAKEEKKQYPVLSSEAENIITELDKVAGRVFILAGRRGVASQTVCQDCGTLVLCSRCRAPMVLHGSESARTFLCHTCGEAAEAKTVCAHCGGWRLKPLGIGIEKVEEQIKLLTKCRVLRIDSDTTKTKKKIQNIITDFYTAESAVLLGTTMALPYLHTKVQTSIIASLDSLLAVPDFAAEERAFRTILTLAEKTYNETLVQTRMPDNEMLGNAKEGAIAKFVERELSLRRKFKYPPYATFIKISLTGSKEYTVREVKKLVKVLEDYKPRVFRGFEPKYGGKYTLHTLVRFTHKWPDGKLLNLLHSLPPSFVVQIT